MTSALLKKISGESLILEKSDCVESESEANLLMFMLHGAVGNVLALWLDS